MSAALAGRRIVVTGGAGGIGAAIVSGCVEAGAAVVSADLASVATSRPGVTEVQADLSLERDNLAALDAARAAMGGIDAIVAAAGFQHVASIEEFPVDVWRKLLDVMVTSPFLLARGAWPDLAAHGDGRFIAISSVHGLRASPSKSGYVTAKHAVVGLVRTLALEGASAGISSLAICPAFVRTPLVERQLEAIARDRAVDPDVALEILLERQPRRSLIEPEEVAEATVFALGPAGRTMTGTALTLDQGWTSR